MNNYIGHMFEYISIQFLLELNKKTPTFDEIGKWWYKENEIDIVTLGNKNKFV